LSRTKEWGVASLRELDTDRITLALFLIVFGQSGTQFPGLDPDNAVLAGVETFTPVENLHPDTVLLDALRPTIKGLFNYILKKISLAIRGPEGAAGEDFLEMLPDGGGVGNSYGFGVQSLSVLFELGGPFHESFGRLAAIPFIKILPSGTQQEGEPGLVPPWSWAAPAGKVAGFFSAISRYLTRTEVHDTS
jgi:hypothetical protein